MRSVKAKKLCHVRVACGVHQPEAGCPCRGPPEPDGELCGWAPAMVEDGDFRTFCGTAAGSRLACDERRVLTPPPLVCAGARCAAPMAVSSFLQLLCLNGITLARQAWP